MAHHDVRSTSPYISLRLIVAGSPAG